MSDEAGTGLTVHPDPVALADAAADLVEASAAAAIRDRGVFHLVLAGGSTPRLLYRMLDRPPRRDRIDWSRTHVWFGDERCVAQDDLLSNYRMANAALLDRVPLSEGALHAIDGGSDPEATAVRYEAEIRSVFGDAPVRFDLVLLGMGNDGHTASLFPSMAGLREETRLALSSRSPVPPHERVTMSLRAINAARAVAFLIAGSEKAESLGWVLLDHSKGPAARLPAAMVHPTDGQLHWFVDRAAAPFLSPRNETA